MSSSQFQTRIFSSTPKSQHSQTMKSKKRQSHSPKLKILSYRNSLESRNRGKRWEMVEHKKQIAHLNRRISEIGSLNQRKKKSYDMIVHPVLFLRGKNQLTPKLKIKFVEKVLKRPEKIQVYEQITQLYKKSSQLSKDQQVKDLARLLLDIIVKRRLYKNDELNEFMNNIRENCVLDKTWIDDAISKVMHKLDM